MGSSSLNRHSEEDERDFMGLPNKSITVTNPENN